MKLCIMTIIDCNGNIRQDDRSPSMQTESGPSSEAKRGDDAGGAAD